MYMRHKLKEGGDDMADKGRIVAEYRTATAICRINDREFADKSSEELARIRGEAEKTQIKKPSLGKAGQ